MCTWCVNSGEGDEKGKVMGIFRSLGALARALGPVIACTGIHTITIAVVYVSVALPHINPYLIAVFWSYSACVVYMIGAGLMLVPLSILFFAGPPHKKEE